MISSSPQLGHLPSNKSFYSGHSKLRGDIGAIGDDQQYKLMESTLSGSIGNDDNGTQSQHVYSGARLKKMLLSGIGTRATHRYEVEDMDGKVVLSYNPLGIKGVVPERVFKILVQ